MGDHRNLDQLKQNSSDFTIGMIQAIPKAELHVHLEGTIGPRTLVRLAQKNKIPMESGWWDKEGVYQWKDFDEFLSVYNQVSALLKTPDDYTLITYDYLISLHQQGCVYAELSFSPDHAKASGMAYLDALEGVCKGIQKAQQDTGIASRIIIIFVRQWGIEVALKTFGEVLQHRHPWVVGIGLGGDEVRFPGSLFAPLFYKAHEAGFGCTIHTGEFLGPEYIKETLKNLPITRIGHGVRSIEDPALLDMIAERNITLECCPTSNIRLGIFSSYQEHPIPRFIRHGIKVTLNSDDPPFFGTSLLQEYAVGYYRLGLDQGQLLQCSADAIAAAFVDDATKKMLDQRIRSILE